MICVASLGVGRGAGERVPLWVVSVLSVALLAGPILLLIVAGQHGADGCPILLLSLQPLLLGVVSSRWSLAMALAPGAVLVLLDGSVAFAPGKLPWILLAAAAMALQAWGLHFAGKRLPGRSQAALLRSLAIAAGMAAVVLGAASLIADPTPRLAPWQQWGAEQTVSLAVLGCLAGALPYFLLWRVFASARLAPEQIAVTQWVQTLTALAESAFFARAHLSLLDIAAFITLAVCIVLVLRGDGAEQANSIAFLGSPAQEQRAPRGPDSYTHHQ